MFGQWCGLNGHDFAGSHECAFMATQLTEAAPGIAGFSDERAVPISHLLAELPHDEHPGTRGKLLRFAGVGQRDVYNITAPFEFGGVTLIAGRVEERDSELAEIVLFRQEGETWRPHFTSPMLQGLQDPCVCFIGDELVIGGVRYPVALPNGSHTWIMDFFRGRTLDELRPLLRGPARMKDIRFCELADGRVGVFSRPQGVKGGRGKIGFCIADSLSQVNAEMIQEAPLLANQFAEGEWGGANEVHLLPDGRLGVLGHIARWGKQRHRHYYPMSFVLDPFTLGTTPIRLLGRRSFFPPAPSKRPDLEDVIFSGGLLRQFNGMAQLYCGLGDAAAGYITLPDPFAVAPQLAGAHFAA
jgi:hypothetical protein